MKNLTSLSLLLFLLFSCTGQEVPDEEFQIKTAVLAAPEHQRSEATVLGYDGEGEVVTLRAGTNDFVCLADDPNKEGFSVAAYHKTLEPYMARGRALKKEGLDFKQVFDKREEEVKAGILEIPDKATLYVTTGDPNKETGEVENLYTRYVIYIPYATEESTGMPLSPPAPGAPWIMDPGTHRAHIMINPPKN
ncbi:MAG: hypothetical protein RLN88_11815 [Ekhidna sp.]|uniref:hypothetical protein n=1 Tax=Ekhidna sp. TaxID=2608089 RepID=UPI0032F01334